MSLINDTLNQLEKNKRNDRLAREEALSGIVPTSKKRTTIVSKIAAPLEEKEGGSSNLKNILLAIILAIGISIIWHYFPQIITTISKDIAVLKNKTHLAQLNKPTKQPAIVKPVEAPIVKLEHILLEQKNKITILDFILTAPIQYYIEHNSLQQLTITLNNTEIAGNLPVNLDNSFIVSLNTKQNKNNTVITITLLPGTKLDELQLINKPQPYLHLAFSNPQLVSTMTVEKKPIPLPPEQQAAQHYQEIQQLLTQNNIQEAISRLRLFVADFPNHLQACETLVSLLIKEGRLQKAQEILTVALNRHGDHHPFIKLKAYILAKQNETSSAIALLQKFLSTTDDIDYLSLLAALYLQEKEFMSAALLYDHLTKIQPQTASWWLGLGVALEHAGKKNAAKEAYRQARTKSDTTSDLAQFLDDKIK